MSNISEHFKGKTDFFLVLNDSTTTQAETVFANHGEKKILKQQQKSINRN